MNNLRVHLLSSAAVLLIGTSAANVAQAQAQAQDPGPTPTETPPAVQPEPSQLGEIIVTARRREERLIEVPGPVTARTGDQLAAAGIESTRDLSPAVPGLSFTMQGAWAQPALRGVTSTSSSAGAENPVALYVDGIYQPSMIGSFFDLPDVERIEVLKGPQGTLFGRNATGGAIQIVTQRPKFTSEGQLQASAGYYFGGSAEDSATYQLKGYLTGPFSEKVAGSLTFLVDHTDGYMYDIVRNERDGEIDSLAARGKLLYVVNDDFDLQFSAYYMDRADFANTTPFPFRGNSAAANRPGMVGVVIPTKPWHTAHDTRPEIDMRGIGADLRATWNVPAGTLVSLTGYTKNDNMIHVDTDASYAPPGEPSTQPCFNAFVCVDYIVKNPAESLSQEFNFASRDFGSLNFVAGVFGYWAEQGSFNDINFGTQVRNNTLDTRAYAAYAEATYDVTDRLSAVFGGRYSYEERELWGVTGRNAYPGLVPQTHFGTWNWDAFTPRLALRYALDDATNVYASYSQGFKSGQPNNLGGQQPANPEYLSAYEVGIKSASSLYSLEASAFYYDYTDLQVQSFTGTATLTTNAANAIIYGVDIDGRYRVTDELQARVAVSYIPKASYENYTTASYSGFPRSPSGAMTTIQPADVSGERMIRTPELTVTGQLDYDAELEQGRLRANATVYYSDSYFWELGYRVTTDAYTTVNARLAFQPRGSNVEFALFGKNLTNEAYVQGAVLSNNADMVVFAPPRMVGVSLQYSF